MDLVIATLCIEDRDEETPPAKLALAMLWGLRVSGDECTGEVSETGERTVLVLLDSQFRWSEQEWQANVQSAFRRSPEPSAHQLQ